jgi:hypothetical protein
MRFQKWTACYQLALLVFSLSLPLPKPASPRFPTYRLPMSTVGFHSIPPH